MQKFEVKGPDNQCSVVRLPTPELHSVSEKTYQAGGYSKIRHLNRSPGGGVVKKGKRGTPSKFLKTSTIRKIFKKNITSPWGDSETRLTMGTTELLPLSSGFNQIKPTTTTDSARQTTKICASQPERGEQTRPRDILDFQVRPSQDWPSPACMSLTDQSQMLGQDCL